MSKFAMLIDTLKCTACRGCQVACKQWNEREGWYYSKTVNRGSYENPLDLSPQTWTRIKFIEYEGVDNVRWLFFQEGCMHCSKAVCVDVCPTQALKYGPMGIVTVERDLCNGCGYCTQFCPFHIPRLEVENHLSGQAKITKCHFCQDRATNGLIPACIKTCPVGALSWGDREEMLVKAKARVEVVKAEGGLPNANLYGEKELGGLGRLYILTERPSLYGLPEKPHYPALATVWQDLVQPLGGVALGATILGVISAYLVARRNIRMEEVK